MAKKLNELSTIEFRELSEAFREEFRAQKDGTFHENLQLADLRDKGHGRGIIATEDIPADTELFTIPRDYVISVENSRLYKVLPEIFEQSNTDNANEDEQDDFLEDGSPMPKPWLDLILVLIHDYLHCETSKWKAYWAVLPQSFDTLMFWTDEELAELKGSAVPGRIGKASANEMFQNHIIPLFKRHESIFYSDTHSKLTDEELLELCHRMGSLIMAYAFDLRTSDEEEDEQDGWAEDTDTPGAMGMVPMADMLNADAEFNAHLEHGDTHLTMRSLRLIRKGEEVLNYYGPLGNGDLARRYGYTSYLHARYDVVEIQWETVLRALQEHFGTSDFAHVDIDQEDMEDVFVLERETGDPDETGKFTQKAEFTSFPEELIDQVSAFVSVGLGFPRGKKLSEDEKKKLKGTVLRVLQKAIMARTLEYPAEPCDAKSLAKAGTNPRSGMAVQIRRGESILLSDAQVYISSLLPKYGEVDGGSTESEQPAQKKQKRHR